MTHTHTLKGQWRCRNKYNLCRGYKRVVSYATKSTLELDQLKSNPFFVTCNQILTDKLNEFKTDNKY
jgi:hypothetical protein